MSLDPVLVQRVRSFVSAMQPRFDVAVRSFQSRFAFACSASRSIRMPQSRRERFDFATAFSSVMKHLDDLEQCPELRRMSDCFASAGLTPASMGVARSCVLGALKEAAGARWNSDIESDLAAVIGEVFSQVNLGDERRRAAA